MDEKNKSLVKVLLLVLFIFSITPIKAQSNKTVYITGATIDLEQVQAVPFVTIFVKGSNRGTVSDNNGYFSFLAVPGDTLVFSSVGYKTDEFALPESLQGTTFSLLHLMVSENVMLEEVVVQPWPSVEQFTKSILNIDLPKDAQKMSMEAQMRIENLAKSQYQSERVYYDQWRYNKLYDMTGVAMPNNFINPMQWANFIRDWKSGVYKKSAEGQQIPLPRDN